MVLGEGEALTAAMQDDFRAASLTHLVAASGQNVALLAALAVALGTALGLGLRGRLLLALALVVLYVPLAGAGPSIQRAGIMGGAALVAALAGRPASRCVCAAARGRGRRCSRTRARPRTPAGS